jgi:ABC-2 type transport system permease protein
MNFRSGLEYKGWWMMVIVVLFHVVTDPLSTILLFSRFGSIGVWSVERIIMIYAMAVASFGLAEVFCRGFDYFPWHSVRTGAFDRMLLRPTPLFVQIAGSYFHIHRLARVAGGLCAIGWSLWRQGVELSFSNILMLTVALLSGFIVYSGVFIITIKSPDARWSTCLGC